MRRRLCRLVPALIVFVIPATVPDALRAQERVTLRADILLYGDNTEFRNPFREGETVFGTALRLYGVAHVADRVDIALGFVGNQHFGSADVLDVARPIVTLTIKGVRSTFSFGTFLPPSTSQMTAPERSSLHGLLPPLQIETRTFTRPHEAGFLWRFNGARLQHEAWLNWQRLNTAAHRERFDTGVTGQLAAGGAFAIPFQFHVVHEGGQLFASGPVRDSAAGALGLGVSGAAGPFENVAIEIFGLASRYVPDRAQPQLTRSGAGFLGRASAERAGWRGHILFWRGDDFVKDEGDPNYQSIRRDGSRYRGVRDYAEAGLTRSFNPAPGVTIAASARLHRTEKHYEYSYRVIGVAALKWKLR
jgi:hypothetical protein